MDRTVYHFMLAHNQLYDALDRFSGFFTSPLFTEVQSMARHFCAALQQNSTMADKNSSESDCGRT